MQNIIALASYERLGEPDPEGLWIKKVLTNYGVSAGWFDEFEIIHRMSVFPYGIEVIDFTVVLKDFPRQYPIYEGMGYEEVTTKLTQVLNEVLGDSDVTVRGFQIVEEN